MKLFLDDSRKFPPAGFQCCRDAKTAITLLSVLNFDFISLDYSLEEELTGLDVLKFMKEKSIFVPRINIHSNNIEGIRLMRRYCEENFPDSQISCNTLDK